nr:MAG TPA: hypothetical protein [Caudoviricetes sp.]
MHPYETSPLSQHCWGRGVFLLFGVFARPPSADPAPGPCGVPRVDGLRQPAACAADHRVRLGQLVPGQRAGRDAQSGCDLGEA